MEQANQAFNVSYRRSSRARRLRITIEPTQTVTVTVPLNQSLGQAEGFVRSKQAWIQKHLRKMRQTENMRQVQPELSPDELNKAQEELFSRLEHFSDKYNLSYRRAAFRCQKTRWGSCSSQNNISLNINVVYLPNHLQDYILLHELCHIRHKNHSHAFWGKLNTYCHGKAKEFAKELKKYGMKIRRS